MKLNVPLWLREVLHFLAWTLPVYLAQGFLDYFFDSGAVGFFVWWTGPKIVGVVIILWTIQAERNELAMGLEDHEKFWWDNATKIGGVVVSLMTAGWWMEVL